MLSCPRADTADTNVIAFPAEAGKRMRSLWACFQEIDDLPVGCSLELEGNEIVLGHRNHVMGLWRESRGFLTYIPLAQCGPAFMTDYAAEAIQHTLLLIRGR
jgi:hypothetical protein